MTPVTIDDIVSCFVVRYMHTCDPLVIVPRFCWSLGSTPYMLPYKYSCPMLPMHLRESTKRIAST